MSFLTAQKHAAALRGYVPGLVLVVVITAAAYGLRGLPFLAVLSPMIMAILLGMIFANTSGVPAAALPGVSLCGKRLLRAVVALLGLQITLGDIAQVGLTGVLGAAISLTCTFIFTLWLGRLLGVRSELRYTLAGGLSICGASAAAAVGTTVRAKESDISYAIACVTLFGTIVMFLFPLMKGVLGLDSSAYGQWIGFSVHEVAQVVAAGFQHGETDGEIAVVAKLTRVMMLAPVVVIVALMAARRLRSADAEGRPATAAAPAFVVAFIVLMIANGFGLVPDEVKEACAFATPIMLTAALAALGLGTRIDDIMRLGFKPLVLAGTSSLFIAGVGLLWVKLV